MRVACTFVALLCTWIAAEEKREPAAGAQQRAVGELKRPEWGEAENGLRMRLSARKESFAAGEAMPMTLEIQNVSDATRSYRMPVIPFNHTLIVVDEKGQEAPYLGGMGGVQAAEKKLEARESQVIRAFNLSDIFYLRRPGRYTVKSHDETHTEVPAPFEFQVLADPQMAAADGDPVGRLLPLVKKDQSLVSHPKTTKLNPGGNRGEVSGELICFVLGEDSRIHPKMVWVWLTEGAAPMREKNLEWPPPSEDIGKVDRWQVYMSITGDADKDWPTAREDIKRALAGPPVLPELKRGEWGEVNDGLRSRLVAEKQKFPAGEAIAMKVEVENVSKEPREFEALVAPHWGTLKVLDQKGIEMPFILGPAQILVSVVKLGAGESREFGSFDLAKAFYLRKAGRYTVESVEVPAFAPLAFEVIENAALAAAEGDPIGRLLPLVKKDWSLAVVSFNGGKAGRAEPGVEINFVYNPTGFKKDTGLVMLWLGEKEAVENPRRLGDLAGEYLGKLSHWHVYFAATDKGLKDWPTAREDIKRALEAKGK